MADVQQVEHAVGEDDARAAGAGSFQLGAQDVKIQDAARDYTSPPDPLSYQERGNFIISPRVKGAAPL